MSVASEVTLLKIIKRLNKHILIFLFSSEELFFGKQIGIKRFMRCEVQSDWLIGLGCQGVLECHLYK